MEDRSMDKVTRYFVGSVSHEGFLELCYDDETGETRDYELQSPDLKDSRDSFVLASVIDEIHRIAADGWGTSGTNEALKRIRDMTAPSGDEKHG